MHNPVPTSVPDPDDLISEVRALRRRPGQLRILVFGTNAWLTWSVARCLHHARYQPVVLGPRELSSLCRFAGCVHLPLPAVTSTAVLDGVEAVCRTHEIDVVVPVDPSAMQRLATRPALVQSARIAAAPDADTLQCCTDRWHFASLLAELNIPHAAAELAIDAGELRDTRLTFPIATRSLAASDESIRQYDSLAELTLALLQGLESSFPRFIQEIAPGVPVGFGFLARHGRLMAHTAFEARAPHAWRYFEAKELRSHAARVIEALSYHGVGVIESRYDPDRHTYGIAALRPGFWNSHLCAERAGMNFPDLLARLPDLGPGAGFMATPRPVSLSYLERGVAGVIRLTALAETLRTRLAGSLAP